MSEILHVNDIYKNFGAVQALSGFSMSVNEGEIVGLMGDNGAGKSTILKILAGNYLASSGTVNFMGKDVVFNSPNDARKQGVEVVYQDLALCNHLTLQKIFILVEKRSFSFNGS
ncbi:hypothetical protein CM15mP35_03490 [bacterium]|nr:MAG: hypothetical protein CM15mP35_03490 [bacterium]